jgi:hypothetical protein
VTDCKTDKAGFSGWDSVAVGCPSTSSVQDETPLRQNGEQKCTILRDSHDVSTPGLSDGCKVLCRLKSSSRPNIIQSSYLLRSRGRRLGLEKPCGNYFECYNPIDHGILPEINELSEADRHDSNIVGVPSSK